MNREAVERWCERGVVGLLLAILVFGPLAMGAVPTEAFLVIQVLAMGVLALWVARIWAGARPRVLWRSFAMPLLRMASLSSALRRSRASAWANAIDNHSYSQ